MSGTLREVDNGKHQSLLTCKARAVISMTGMIGNKLSYNEAFNLAKSHYSSFIVTKEVADGMIAEKTTLSPPCANSFE